MHAIQIISSIDTMPIKGNVGGDNVRNLMAGLCDITWCSESSGITIVTIYLLLME